MRSRDKWFLEEKRNRFIFYNDKISDIRFSIHGYKIVKKDKLADFDFLDSKKEYQIVYKRK